MQQTVWMIGQFPQPANASTVGEVSGLYRQVKGLYVASVSGSECVLKLYHNSHGFVHGSFTAEEETLEFRGGYSPTTGDLQGYVFEPFGMLPVASLTAKQTVQGLSAQMKLLEFDTQGEPHQPEQLSLSRVMDLADPAKDAHEGLISSFR